MKLDVKIKQKLLLFVFILFAGAGPFVGYFLHHHLTYLGVTFITLEDVIGCYFFGIVACFLIGAFIVLKLDE
jgi:hypothetical protein